MGKEGPKQERMKDMMAGISAFILIIISKSFKCELQCQWNIKWHNGAPDNHVRLWNVLNKEQQKAPNILIVGELLRRIDWIFNLATFSGSMLDFKLFVC